MYCCLRILKALVVAVVVDDDGRAFMYENGPSRVINGEGNKSRGRRRAIKANARARRDDMPDAADRSRCRKKDEPRSEGGEKTRRKM